MSTALALPEHAPAYVAERAIVARMDLNAMRSYHAERPTPLLRLFPNGEARYAELAKRHWLFGMHLAHNTTAR